MHIVYLLKSLKKPIRYYIGICDNLKNRLREHNFGVHQETAVDGPWDLKTALYFSDKRKAHNFQQYLKSESGIDFCKRYF